MSGFETAKREAFSLIVGIAGGSGGGKTMSALRVARGIAGEHPFLVVDTEARRSRMYADHFQPWQVADLEPPFTPARYLEMIERGVASAPPVIVVDSFSHEHEGEGGLLDMQEAEVQRMAGDNYAKREAVKMAAWIKPKREHKAMMRRLTRLNTHLIVCLRAEEKVEMKRSDSGKLEVIPMVVATGAGGWVPIGEKRLPYELTLSLLVTPDAPGVPKPIKLPEDLKPMVPLDRVLDEEVGRRLAEWAAGDGTSAPAPLVSDLTAELKQRLYDLAATAGRVEEVMEASERAAATKTPVDYQGWLDKQIGRFKEASS